MTDNIKADAERAAEAAKRYGEYLGMKCIPQFYAVAPQLLDDGSEFALAVGPMRYDVRKALEDANGFPGRTAVAVVVRFADPDDAEELVAMVEHQQAAADERRQLGGES